MKKLIKWLGLAAAGLALITAVPQIVRADDAWTQPVATLGVFADNRPEKRNAEHITKCSGRLQCHTVDGQWCHLGEVSQSLWQLVYGKLRRVVQCLSTKDK